ncbi:MAG TPA: bifunctional serine/threonine-protein kinase/formylglycine-generating enzyme family protein, partial [Blastocatellia bacterium]
MPVDGEVLQGRYCILRKLSDKGGMGVVYQAEDLRLHSQVVVKETRYLQLNPDMRDTALKAFSREARLLANLRHAVLPRVMDYFNEGDGYFLVMEFIPGKDLEELLSSRGEGFPVEDVLQWADRLLETLEYLHDHDEPIIHRDIKPANLKLTPRGEVMLLDFGLAKGAVVGTPAASSVWGYTRQYAPLEQIKGTGTNPRSDLFSLAATLYHLLTGHAPPDAIERISEVAIGNPDPLRPMAELNRSVSANISALISSAMAIKPDDRPATAAAMRQALREIKQAPKPGPVAPNASTAIVEAETIARPPRNDKPITPSKLPESFKEDLSGALLEMIFVPGGAFKMGSVGVWLFNEKPQRAVTAPGFYVGKYQITQAQWKSVMGDSPSRFHGHPALPVENVSWNDAKQFCEKISQMTGKAYRLPSEAEWEYACRAETTGDYAGDLGAMAWYGTNSFEKTHPVGQKQPNAFGLYDMHGNVSEWCEDTWHVNYNGGPIDGSAWLSGGSIERVARGG